MSRDNDRITTEESVSTKAKETGQILKELVASIGRKTMAATEEKTDQLKEAADDKDLAVRDAMDIQMLGSHIDSILAIFDSTMDRIAQQSYDEQQKLMVGFKKVVQEEISVINAMLNMARRLKGLQPPADRGTIESRVQERTAMNMAEAVAPVSETEKAHDGQLE